MIRCQFVLATLAIIFSICFHAVVFVPLASAYGEPPSLFEDPHRSAPKLVEWIEPHPCSGIMYEESGGHLSIHLKLLDPAVVCVDIRVRSAHGAAVWYYEIPPPAEPVMLRLCRSRSQRGQEDVVLDGLLNLKHMVYGDGGSGGPAEELCEIIPFAFARCSCVSGQVKHVVIISILF